MPKAIANTVAGRTSYLLSPISYSEVDIWAGWRSPLPADVPTIAGGRRRRV